MDTGNLRAKVEENTVNGVFDLNLGSIVQVYANQNNNAEVDNVAQLGASEIVVPVSKEDSNGTQCKESYDLKLTKDNEEKESDYYAKLQWRKIDGKAKHLEKFTSHAGNGYIIQHVLAARNKQYSFLTDNSSNNVEKIKDAEKNCFATSASAMTTIPKNFIGMNQELLPKYKESMEYLLSKPSINVTKPRREGHLPSYNFNFKCDERAHKRKEFHMKLEEKIRARELQRAIIEAKLKEFEEEQIKIIRKASAFKAKPLPSFYFERSQQKNMLSMPKPLKPRVQKTHAKTIPEGAHYTNHLPVMVMQTHAVSESCRLPCKKPLQRSFHRLSSGY